MVLDRNCAQVSGFNARGLLLEVGGRPMWSAVSSAWMVQPSTAKDAVALAESKGYDVVVTGGPVSAPEPPQETPEPPELDLFGQVVA